MKQKKNANQKNLILEIVFLAFFVAVKGVLLTFLELLYS